MNIEFLAPILGWKTLKEIYDYYLVQTPSEEGISATEVIDRAAKQTLLHGVAIKVHAASGSLQPERASEVLASIKEVNDQADRMRAIVAHLMIRDAAEGRWFAVGRMDGVGEHQLIHPRHWNFLLMDTEKGVVGRDSLRFEDLRCAFTRDVPADHPIYAVVQMIQKESAPASSAANIGAKAIASPPTAPPRSSRTSHHDGPGRPSTFHLIDNEFEQRIKRNAIEPSLRKQVQALSSWFKTANPQLQPYQPKTIANRLRARYRAARPPRSGPKI